MPRERLPRAEPWSGGSPDPIPNSAVKPHLAESTAAPGRGRTGRSARRGRFLRLTRPDGTAGPADAAAPTGTRPRPLFGARRGAEAAWPRGGASPGACRTLADFLGRTCATKLYYYLDAHAGVFLFQRADILSDKNSWLLRDSIGWEGGLSVACQGQLASCASCKCGVNVV